MATVAPEPSASAGTAAASRLNPVLLGVWLLAIAYVALHVDRGWVPHDEGVLGQSAERVLRGELPHRDFSDPYTGGLSFLHALAFAVFGVKLIALRWVLLLFAAAWVPALYYVASRFVGPLAAGTAVLLATVWGLPNYPAPMPSWYNLFFAVFGAAALLRYLETERRRWLVVAGVAGGLSVLVKVTGLYYVAGALLFLAYRQQILPARGERREPPPGVYGLTVAGAMIIFLALLIRIVASRAGVAEFANFVVSPVAIVALLLWNRGWEPGASSGACFAALGRLVLPFGLGLAVTVLPLLVVYVRAGAVADLLVGVLVQPLARLSNAAKRPAPFLPSLFAMLPLVLLLARGCRAEPWAKLDQLVIAVTLASALGAAATDPVVHSMVWYSVRALVPAATIAGVAILLHPRVGRSLAPLRRQQLVLLLSVTAMVALVQFPFSAAIYFCFVAPALVLTIVAILASVGGVRSFAAASAAGFYLLFAALFVNRASGFTLGQQYTPQPVARLALPRGGIRVPPVQGEIYQLVVEEIQRRAPDDDYIYATPDCPEIYFLAAKRNPTHNLFEFLDTQPGDPGAVLELLARHRIGVVVVSHIAQFSKLDPALARALAAQFPDSVAIGPFVVRWRS